MIDKSCTDLPGGRWFHAVATFLREQKLDVKQGTRTDIV